MVQNPRTKERFPWSKYRVQVRVIYPMCKFYYILPPSGRFPDDEEVITEVTLNFAAASQITEPYTSPERGGMNDDAPMPNSTAPQTRRKKRKVDAAVVEGLKEMVDNEMVDNARMVDSTGRLNITDGPRRPKKIPNRYL